MSIYKGTTLIAGALPNSANQDLSNLSQTGQAVIDGKADTDLSNLTSTASTNFDGEIISNTHEIISSSTTINAGVVKTYSLSSYLPNDNNIYEVYYSVDGNTGTTSGNMASIACYSSLIGNTNYAAKARTRTSNSVTWAASGVIPIGTDRNIYLKNYDDAVTVGHFRVFAYRRIGTNQ